VPVVNDDGVAIRRRASDDPGVDFGSVHGSLRSILQHPIPERIGIVSADAELSQRQGGQGLSNNVMTLPQ
jgi:hypothetical protein